MHIVPMTALVVAQERPRPTAEFAAGWVGFADDGIVSESLVGAAGRWYLRPRISVGPEVVYIFSDNHSHLMVTGNVTWDLLAPMDGRPPSIAPFLVVGGGVFQTRETFFSGTFTSNEGAFTAGGGVRAAIGDRITIGVDTRVGWELHLLSSNTNRGKPEFHSRASLPSDFIQLLGIVTPETGPLRHTFCSHLAMRGAPARAIQELAGHQDLSTTQRYMHLSPAAIEGAIRLLEQPRPTGNFGDISNDVGGVKRHVLRSGRRSRLSSSQESAEAAVS